MGAVGRQIRPLSVTAGSAMAARGARWAIIPYGLTIGVMFPYCDGSHRKHNSIARDNVGPLIITKMFGSEHTLFLQH
ncbi:uncharacterized protein LOC132405459 isoform X2 [Hypanus sabinus]|uniref:uncharacterized protein LOC132405459 isoform X2 n=1 Tax=Hypanus sabinus TaxID=79690 RepID=UPI0028C4C112|nr:uncharacterized protein LOC132405459 isoform X2 [Hypanus sabinus]